MPLPSSYRYASQPVHVSHMEPTCPAPKDKEQQFEFDPTLPPLVLADMDRFRRAVFTEMYYLRDQGGHEVHITNGALVGRHAAGFAYAFDLESELFLADDAPVKLSVGGKAVDGVVLACEEFQVTLLLQQNMGESISSAVLSANPWQLLDALNKRLALINPHNHPLAVQLMSEGPRLATDEPIKKVASGQLEAQRRAKEDPITVIWGPPGTGKTHTMAQIAIDAMLRGQRVLAVSHSNVSVDGIILKIADLMRENGMEKYLWRGHVMRFGHVRDERLAKSEDTVTYNYALSADPARLDELHQLQKKRAELAEKGQGKTSEALDVQDRIRKIRKSVAADEVRCVKNARILGTTVSKLYANRIFDDMKFDVVMFDEVSMAYVPQIVCAAMYATQRLVLVGDFRQLAPIAQSKARESLCRDVFAYLRITDSKQQAHYHPWLVMLNVQRRMHPQIAAFPREQFYDGLLLDHANVIHGRDDIVALAPFPRHAVTLVDLRGAYCASASNSDHSRFNILSAVVSFGIAVEAVHAGATSVGVIAPYAAQARLVRALLRDRSEALKEKTEERKRIACSTVHQFQGSERDVIVLDVVESYPQNPGVLTSKNENGSVDRLVNVAVTRARGKLVTVANASYWEDHVGLDNAIRALTKHHRISDQVVNVRRGGVAQLLSGFDLGPSVAMFDEDAAFGAFLKDLASTSHRVVISIPDGHLEQPAGKKIAAALREARTRGVEVLVKCFNARELPEDWKTYAWQSEDAVFPLAVMDGTVCWYDMPPSRDKPPVKNGLGPATTLHVPIRITGRHTVDLIWSLTGLDVRVTGEGKQALRPRMGTTAEDEEGAQAYGLARHILEHVKCRDCGAPMRLYRGYKTGKYSLVCTVCKGRDYLGVNEVNHYLSVSQERCPKCGGGLYARVDRRGVYIQCDGDEHHRLRPDEV